MKKLVFMMLLLIVFAPSLALAQESPPEGTTGESTTAPGQQYDPPPEATTPEATTSQSIADGLDDASHNAEKGSAVRGMESYTGEMSPREAQALTPETSRESPKEARAKIKEVYGYDELPDTGGPGLLLPLAAAFLVAGAVVIRRS